MGTNLLIESLTPTEGNIVTESVKGKDGKKKICLKGVFMQADVNNRNGRNYPMSEIAGVVSNAANTIKTHGGIFGELDHPQTLTINMDRVSHVIKELYMDGANAIGKAELLDTPMGQIAQVMAESGARYGVSSRGTGDVGDNGTVKGYNFVTCDLVVTPSAEGAMPNPIYESLQQEAKGRQILTLSEAAQEDPRAQKFLKKEILKFFSSILP
jgi:hypothetical protein